MIGVLVLVVMTGMTMMMMATPRYSLLHEVPGLVRPEQGPFLARPARHHAQQGDDDDDNDGGNENCNNDDESDDDASHHCQRTR